MRSCPMAQPIAGGIDAAELGHQAVVAAAGAHRALRPQAHRWSTRTPCACSNQSAHQMRLHMILDAGAAQLGAQRIEMLARLRIQRIEQQRRTRDDPLHVRILAVENPQRIAGQAPLAVLIQGCRMAAEIGRQLLAIDRARCRRAERVHHQLHAASIPAAAASRADNRIISASTSGPSKPKASASI